jgi:hypothetical protein
MHAGMVSAIKATPVNQAMVSRRERIWVKMSHMLLGLCQKSAQTRLGLTDKTGITDDTFVTATARDLSRELVFNL